MLIADTDASVRKITDYISPWGFDIIHYRSALKAIDNIEEIKPDAVFISTSDFPRHWKTIVQFIRADTGKDRTIIILLTGDRFTSDDANKAVYIGVQAIINETLTEANDEKQILQIFSRYRHIEMNYPGFDPSIAKNAVFLFTNHLNDAIITGKIEGLSTKEICFKPDAPSMTAELAIGEIMDQCSLKLHEKILSIKCRIRKNDSLIVLELLDLRKTEVETIGSFISGSV